MDKGRTGPQGPLEEPDENQRRSRPPLQRSSDGTPINRRRGQRPTGPTGSTGRIGPNSAGPTSQRLNPQRPPEEMPGTKPPIRRASRAPQPQQEPLEDTSPRSRPLSRNTRPQQPVNEPEEDYYERRPRPRRHQPPPEDFEDEDDYYERRPRSRRLPEEVEDDEVYYERRPLPRRSQPEPEDFEEEEDYYEPRARSQRLTSPQGRQPSRYRDEDDYVEPSRKRRRVLPIVLTGCGLTIFTLVLAAGVAVFLVLRSSLPQGGNGGTGGSGGQVALPVSTMTVNLTSVTRIQVCDKIGNVTITIDPNASAITVATKKSVPQGNTAEADRIVVEVPTTGSAPADLACVQHQDVAAAGDSPLIVNALVPKGDRADITVTLPPGVFSSTVAPMPFNVEAQAGDISITNFNSIPSLMFIVGNDSNITMKNVILGNGSQIRTGNGNLTFNGALSIPNDATTPISYKLQCSQGNIDATFLPGSTGVTLDARTNSGTVNSAFTRDIQIDAPATPGGKAGAHYYGALDPSLTPPQNVFLHLLVDIGNIVIHKASVS